MPTSSRPLLIILSGELKNVTCLVFFGVGAGETEGRVRGITKGVFISRPSVRWRQKS